MLPSSAFSKQRATLASALGDATWAIVPLMSAVDANALSFASLGVRSMLVPACERAAQVRGMTKELQALPFSYRFPLEPLGFEALAESLLLLKSLRLLRRRDLVGLGAGWAPTDEEEWGFQSSADLEQFIWAAQTAKGKAQQGRQPPALMMAAILRMAGEQLVSGPLVTTSLGVEWVNGPTADPLQLGIRLLLGPGERAEVDLELNSGGWSPWSETWALHDGTLAARVAVAAALPGGGTALICCNHHNDPLQEANTELNSCEAENVSLLKEALAAVGEAGIHATVAIGGIDWGKDGPPWFPPEVRRLLCKLA